MFARTYQNIFVLGLIICGLGSVLQFESRELHTTDLERIQRSGEIIIITRNTPTTYYIGAEGPTGFEYELATEFARFLNVYPNVIISNQFSSILPSISRKSANVAAAGITVTESRKRLVNFSDSYQDITQLVIYKAGNKKPRSIEDLRGVTVHVIHGSSHEEQISELHKQYDFLTWQSHDKIDISTLMQKVEDGEFEYAISDSNDYEFNRRFHPKLRKGFEISAQQSLAWVFPKSRDNSILVAANEFLAQSKANGFIDRLHEKHYSHVPGLNYAGAHTFRKHINSRLEDLIPIFKQAAAEQDIDWRFLAAVSYQESLWNPKAVSPTGVRGLMMLTKRTARQLGIENRTDPVDSTKGGASYLVKLKKKIPERIAEPDRTWMALAAYNVGFGHLEDARVLTQTRGGDPDQWSDVRESLPLLTQKEWYKKTKFGYARGHEPVLYVRNIRNYYDLLVWKYNDNQGLQDSITRILPKVM
ncbi:MAG: membrane-bound lytic murein transglycosylase MltF [Gammaproteobacteria bacterium]|nr:membrane-bound lytic murein transglycosylase MltF [Gammaproteobacteria bacterium]